MCGVVAVLVEPEASAVGPLYEALLALQHRGQDAAGIVTEDHGKLSLCKDNGMVRDVFTPQAVANLHGDVGIGHVRYPTAGSSCSAEAQPFYVNSPFGITLAHNGNLVNCKELVKELAQEWRHINTGSDSEVLLNILASELLVSLRTRARNVSRTASPPPLSRASPPKLQPPAQPPAFAPIPAASSLDDRETAAPGLAAGIHAPNDDDVLAAARVVLARCVGGYAVVAMITNYGLLAFRDSNGIRPLVYGRRALSTAPSNGPPPKGAEEHAAFEYMVASESGALTALDFSVVGDVPAGHALLLRRGRAPRLEYCLPAEVPRPPIAPCIFEYVYFARPDSVLDGVSVYRARLRMGAKLAQKILARWPGHDIDVVIPVPDTSRTSALECAEVLGIPYREGFIKNRSPWPMTTL